MSNTDPPKRKRRCYRLTADRLLLSLLPIEGLLFLSERFTWFPFNEHKNWSVLIAIAVVCVALLLMLLWLGASLVSRLRFQFSLRSMLVFIAVVAVVCSWFTVKMQQASKQREAVAAIEKAGGSPTYDYIFDANGKIPPKIPGPPGPPWLRNLFGVDFLSDVRELGYGEQATDAEGKTGQVRYWQTGEFVRPARLRLRLRVKLTFRDPLLGQQHKCF